MTDKLVKLEQELLERDKALHEKAQKTLIDATAVISGSEAARRQQGVKFIEESLQDVLDRAKEEVLEEENLKAEDERRHDECDIPHNATVSARLQRAKIQELERQLKATQEDLREKDKELKTVRNEMDGLREDALRTSERQRKQQVELQKTKTERDRMKDDLDCSKRETRELKTLLADQEKEKRELASVVKKNDVRQRRIAEELDRCKTSMEAMKTTEKETRHHARKDYDKLMAENTKLEKQKSELTVALRKQFKLIDVLKRQKSHLEAAKTLSFVEEEFLKIVSLT